MSEIPASAKAHPEPDVYEIRIRGHLDAHWASRFENLTITLEEDGDTLLTGPVVDQAALHGLLQKVRDPGFAVGLGQPCQCRPVGSVRRQYMNG